MDFPIFKPVTQKTTIHAAMLTGGGKNDIAPKVDDADTLNSIIDSENIPEDLINSGEDIIDFEDISSPPSLVRPQAPSASSGTSELYSNPNEILSGLSAGTIRYADVDVEKLVRSLKGQEGLAVRILGQIYLAKHPSVKSPAGDDPRLQAWVLNVMGKLANSNSIIAFASLYQDINATPELRNKVIGFLANIACSGNVSDAFPVMSTLKNLMAFKESEEILSAISTIGKYSNYAKASAESALADLLQNRDLSLNMRMKIIILLSDSGAAQKLAQFCSNIRGSADDKILAEKCLGKLLDLATISRESAAANRNIYEACLSDVMANGSYSADQKSQFLRNYNKASPSNAVLLIAKFQNNPQISQTVGEICLEYIKSAATDPKVASTVLDVFEDNEVNLNFREELLTELMQANATPVVAYLKGKNTGQTAFSILTFGLAHTHTRLEQVLGGKFSERFRIMVCAGFEAYCAKNNDTEGIGLMALLVKKADPTVQSIIVTSRTTEIMLAMANKTPSDLPDKQMISGDFKDIHISNDFFSNGDNFRKLGI